MHFTHYQKSGDKVFAANPYIIEVKGNFTIVNEEKKKDYLAFETWLSTQSPIYADQSIKDGVYGKELFEEPVWQCYHNNYGWVDIPNAWVKSVEEAKQYDVPARLYIRLKQP